MYWSIFAYVYATFTIIRIVFIYFYKKETMANNYHIKIIIILLKLKSIQKC